MPNFLGLDTSKTPAAYQKQYSGHTSFGHMPNVRLLAHIAAIQGVGTTLAEAVPTLLNLTTAEQEPASTNILTDPSELKNHFRKFVHPTAVEKPFHIPQYPVDDGNEAERESFWEETNVPPALKKLWRFKPIETPNIPRWDPQLLHNWPYRTTWRCEWRNNITYHYPPTQVLRKENQRFFWRGRPREVEKEKPKDVGKGKQRDEEVRERKVYFHLMRHGEVPSKSTDAYNYTNTVTGCSQRYPSTPLRNNSRGTPSQRLVHAAESAFNRKRNQPSASSIVHLSAAQNNSHFHIALASNPSNSSYSLCTSSLSSHSGCTPHNRLE
jgi:hypothetical protein